MGEETKGTTKMFVAYTNDDGKVKSGTFEVLEYVPSVHLVFYDHSGKKNTVMFSRLIKIKEVSSES